jgi:RHH-type proline utilization regulon transcriptional repressor/proline dehydrogenase/delta 1-pyrroline-5-carboxylate dehydrogenase
VFGPVLHVVRWHENELDRLLDDVAANGTALTLGIHSRIDATVAHITRRVPHGNVYVNRNMIGAVVGSQPFGGSGLSGTGPKAGGPHYVQRFALERTVTVNTAASGGNATLLSEDED